MNSAAEHQYTSSILPHPKICRSEVCQPRRNTSKQGLLYRCFTALLLWAKSPCINVEFGGSSEVLTEVRIVLNSKVAFSTIQLWWDSTRSSVADEHKDYGDHGTQFALQQQENWHCPLEVSCKAVECVTLDYGKQQNLSSFPSTEEADISLSTGSMCSIWTLITLLIFPLPSIFAPSNTNVGVCSSSALLFCVYNCRAGNPQQGSTERIPLK